MNQQPSAVLQKIESQNKKQRTVAVVIAIVLLLIGSYVWYNNTHYNSTFEHNFMTACQSKGASASACGCVYSALKRQYSYSQAKDFDANPNSEAAQAAVTSIIKQCQT